ncbi:MAG: hypothetical protein JXR68_02665 [Bacteroidales bacterium]|nr:hypothetical protein [Bacteroidales bacterium]
MKTKLLLIIGFFLITAFQIKAQTVWRTDPFDWQNAYGTAQNSERDGAFCRTSDDNYLLVANSQGTDQTLLYLAKVDFDGNTIWEKTQQIKDFNYSLHHTTVCEGEEGYFYIGGGYHIDNNTPWKPYLIKINNNGDTVWVKLLEGQQYVQYYFNNLIKGNDNSIIATGLFEDYKIIKFDYNGDTVWTLNRQVNEIFALGDRYLAITSNGKLLYVNEDGSIQNQIPAPFYGTQAAARTSDGCIIIKGVETGCYGISKITINGDIVFKTCDLNISCQYLKETQNANIICLGGYSDWYSTHDFRVYLLDNNGNYIKDTILYRSGLNEYPRGLLIPTNVKFNSLKIRI